MNNNFEATEKKIMSLFSKAGMMRVAAMRKLAGDASNRSYYRCYLSNDKSYIVMINAAPEKAIVSEEIAEHNKDFRELPFINIHRCLKQWGINVPAIHYHNASNGMLILDDLGDELLDGIINRSGESADLYKQAIDTLIKFQVKEEQIPKWCYAKLNRFDNRLYNFEFNHFIEYGIVKADVKLPDNIMLQLKGLFYKLAIFLDGYSDIFVHRDYHSRNILRFDGGLYTIDFQDALIGPPHYDLASLLRDAYVDLTDDFVEQMLEYYLSKSPYASAGFRDVFTLISIQRMLKAVGRFRYIKLVKGNDKFMKYIPQLIRRIKRLSMSCEFDPSPEVLAEVMDRIKRGSNLLF